MAASSSKDEPCFYPFNYTVVLYKPLTKDRHGKTRLTKLCEYGTIQTFNRLVEKRAMNLNAKDDEQFAPLHKAVMSKNYNILLGLLEKGAYPDVPNAFYKTPLHLAVEARDFGSMEPLLTFGANPEIKDSCGYSCFRGVFDFSDKSPIEIRDFLKENKQKSKLIPTVFIREVIRVYIDDLDEFMEDRLEEIYVVTFDHFVQYEDVTHYIINDDENYMTMGYLVALLKGVFIVSRDWIPPTAQENWLIDTLDYVPDDLKENIFRACENTYLNRPRLFSGMWFYVLDEPAEHQIYDMKLTKTDLITLIEAGGGFALRRKPTLPRIVENIFYPYHANIGDTKSECCHYIIYNNLSDEEFFDSPRLRHKSSKWLIDCILDFVIVSL